MKRHTGTLGICAALSLLAACPTNDPAASDGTGTDGLTSSPLTTSTSPATTALPSTGDDSTGDPADSGSTTSGGTTGDDSTSDTGAGPCMDARDCDNGVFCDGPESCVEGRCVPGEAPDCADAIDCTADSCDLDRDACVNQPSNDLCGCGETCDTKLGCGNYCQVSLCTVNQPYQCGNCIDDDGDCAIDDQDPDCWGPCDNNEAGFNGGVPGQQNQSTCTAMDCYFDNNSGSGNDECYWSQACDPLEPSGCTYNPNYNTPGTPDSCAELAAEQLPECDAYCGPLTPNGCDCFGCCDLTLEDDTMVTVYLGTLDAEGVGTCTLEVADDPALCHPCTQVPSCLNECEPCELCLGQTELPPECEKQTCPPGLQACGLPGQDPCPALQACITGCCQPEPQ